MVKRDSRQQFLPLTFTYWRAALPAGLALFLSVLLSYCTPQEKPGTVTLVAGAEAQDPRLAQGVSWQLAEHRSRTVASLRYDFNLVIPAEREAAILGEATVAFAFSPAQGDDFPLVLDFVDAERRIDSLAVNGHEIEWQAVADHVLIAKESLRPGDNVISLSFEAGNEALNRNENFLYTLFVPDRAHFSLPLFDQPNLKGEVAWTITAPTAWQVIANGQEQEQVPPTEDTEQLAEVPSPDSMREHRFARTAPLPTYLFAFVAGEFLRETQTLDGRTMTLYHRETDAGKVDANIDAIFELHAQSLRWLEEYTAIDYPFQKFDFVLVPSFQYGGMEHPGSILYRQASLMLDSTATQNQILARASVIAHETAHMWFGDLVTMNWFDDVWTKEVFANFMAAKIVNPAFPEIDHELRFHTAHHPAAYAVDRTAGANPIGQPLENLRYAGSLYGAIIYQKAPIVMRHLENRIGAQALQKGLQEYLSNNAYGNATWSQLITLLDSATEQDLSEWNQAWVYEAGRPRVVVRRLASSPSRFSLHQEDTAGLGRVWPQRLDVLVGGVDSLERRSIELSAEEVLIDTGIENAVLLPNASGLEYADFVLDPESLTAVLATVGKLDDPVARGAAWTLLWEQVAEGRLEADEFLSTAMRELPNEENELIVNRILATLPESFWQRSSAEARVLVSVELEEMLWREVEATHRPRSARASFYRLYRQLATSTAGVARLERLWSGEERVEQLPLSESDQIALAGGLALRGVSNAEEILDRQEQRIENSDRLARFRFVRPSLSRSAEARTALFMSFTQSRNRQPEPWVLEAMRNLHHPLRRGESSSLVRPALDLLEEIQETGDIFFPGRWLDATLGRYQSSQVAQIVRDYSRDNPILSPSLLQKLLQSSDVLFRLEDSAPFSSN